MLLYKHLFFGLKLLLTAAQMKYCTKAYYDSVNFIDPGHDMIVLSHNPIPLI